MLLIGICGKLGSGKDFIANNYIVPFIEKNLSKKCIQLSFADQLKVNTLVKNQDITFESVYLKKTRQSRELLQKEGTDNSKRLYGENIWINYFSNWLKVFETRGYTHCVCSDVRFKNEVDYIKSNGGIIIKVVGETRNETRLNQETSGDIDLYNKIKSHRSECDLDELDDNVFDLVIKNDIDDKINENDIYNLFI